MNSETADKIKYMSLNLRQNIEFILKNAYGQIYLIENNNFENNFIFLTKQYEEFVIGDQFLGYTINSENVIFWSQHKVWYFDLKCSY